MRLRKDLIARRAGAQPGVDSSARCNRARECPACGVFQPYDVEVKGSGHDRGPCWQTVTCGGCGLTWVNHYLRWHDYYHGVVSAVRRS